jgi:hypothetical protein
MAESGNYDRILLNRGLQPAVRDFKGIDIGGDLVRPDIIGIRKESGLFDLIEIQSKTDDLLTLQNKMEAMKKRLGDLQGPIGRVIEYGGGK